MIRLSLPKMLALSVLLVRGFQFLFRLPAVGDIVHNLTTAAQGSVRFLHCGWLRRLTEKVNGL
jgi:hypothetical protein